MSETLHLDAPAQENPLIAEEGLTEEQDKKARYIRTGHRWAEQPVDPYHGRTERGRTLGESLDNVLGPLFDKAYDKAEGAWVMGSAKRHYKKHEGAYQVQAVKDAQARGIETDFGATVIKK